jgi:hypothetical protein
MKPSRTILIRIKKIFKPNIIIAYFPAIDEISKFKALSGEDRKSLDYELCVTENKDGALIKVSIKKLFSQVRKEIDSNLSIPLIEFRENKAYINEVLNLYSEIDEKIIEDENGDFLTDLYRFFKTQSHLELYIKDYEELLNKFKNNLRKEIGYLSKLNENLPGENLKIRDTKPLIKLNADNTKEKSITYKNTSFELNPNVYASDSPNASSIKDEKLKEFKEALLKGGYIKPINLKDFIRIFTNQEVKNPIQWDAGPNDLYYLMKTLYKKELIVQFKNYWNVTCKCFIAHRKNKILCTPHYLQRCKAPTRGKDLRTLNSIIDTLI